MTHPERRETDLIRDSLLAAFERNLDVLKNEIESYENEANIWKVADGITNSGGNLCLHLVGNLNHFIGANLGKTGYVRERDREFSDKGLSRDELLDKIEAVKKTVFETVSGMTEAQLSEEYPEELFEKKMATGTVIAYMSGHLSYHLGQLNYHRRLLDR